MKCDAKRLSFIADAADKIVSSRAISDASKCLMFSGKTARCTNHVTFGTFNLPAGLNFTEDVLVNAKLLTSMIKSLSGDIDVTFNQEKMTLKGNGSTLSLPRTNQVLPAPSGEPGEFSSAGALAKVMVAAAPYAITGGSIQAYQGVCLSGSSVVASDGKVMFYANTEMDIGDERIIPIGEIGHIPVGDNCEIASNENRAYFKYKNAEISTSLMSAKYIKFDRMTSLKYDFNVKAKHEEVSRAVKQAIMLSNESAFVKMKMESKDGKLLLTTATVNGNVDACIDIDSKDEWICYVNAYLVSKFLSSNSCETIGISYNESEKNNALRLRGRVKSCDIVFDTIIATCKELKKETTDESREPKDEF